jgi:hypothetical protein
MPRKGTRDATLDKPVSGDDARTIGELPGSDSLSSFELHEFQPQMGAFTADHKYVFRQRNDFARRDTSLSGRDFVGKGP